MEQFDATLFQHRQQAGDHRIGRDETCQPEPRRQAADAAFDARDAPGDNIVGPAPAAGLACRLDVLAPALERQVLGGMHCIGHLDAPGTLQGGRLHGGHRHAVAVEEFRHGASIAGDRLLPEAAFLRPGEEAARHACSRNLAAQQGGGREVVQPLRRRGALQRLPGERAARRLQFAMRPAQTARQPRRGAQHRRLRPAGQVCQRHMRQLWTDQGPSPPAAASARRGRRAWW